MFTLTKKAKRNSILGLAAVMLAMLVAVTALPLADESNAEVTTGSCGDTATYSLDGTVLTISGTGAMADYTTSSAAPWGTAITSVTIDSGITTIGKYAFYGCTGLTSVTIPSSVTSIGFYAFGCTGLTSVTIPSSVTSIAARMFYDCTSLTAISVADGNTSCSVVDGVLYNADKTLLIVCPAGYSGTVTIPSSVTSITDASFYGCTGLTSVTIPSSVTSIGDHAFYGCTGLTSVTIPSSVTSIGPAYGHAFYGCTGLTSVTIPSSVKIITGFMFQECTALTSVTIPSSVTSIYGHAFDGCTALTAVYAAEAVYALYTTWPSTAVRYDSASIVSYNANGGTGTISDKIIPTGTDADLTVTGITRDGYTLAGWATSAAATEALPSYTVAADTTLYAVWLAQYTVTYNANGGTGTIADATVTSGSAAALPTTGITKDGFTLAGWNTAADATAALTKCIVTADITLYAVWTADASVPSDGSDSTHPQLFGIAWYWYAAVLCLLALLIVGRFLL